MGNFFYVDHLLMSALVSGMRLFKQCDVDLPASLNVSKILLSLLIIILLISRLQIQRPVVGNQHLGMGAPCDLNREDGHKATLGSGEGFDLEFFIIFGAPLVSVGVLRSAGVHRDRAAPRFPGGMGEGWRDGGAQPRGRAVSRWALVPAAPPGRGASAPGHSPRSVACHELVGGAHTKTLSK